MEEAKETLMAMGFDAAAVQNALQETAGNLEQAANLLLSGGGSSAGTTTESISVSAATSDTSVQTVQGSISQYTVENGRSACTYMALQAAQNFLEAAASNATTAAATETVDAAFLDDMVRQGSHMYNTQQRANPSIEHTSAEEALVNFPHLQLQADSGIQQGILSRDLYHPMGLLTLLSACQSATSWTCIVVTKTPETVLICLPPTASSSSSSSSPSFLWIDSHPRPGMTSADQAYCRKHSSLQQLVQTTASRVFPVTDLGPDIPELMATMYNSFDLYPLQWKE